MTFGKTTACVICLATIWPYAVSADEPGPRLLAAAATNTAAPSEPVEVAARPNTGHLRVAEPHHVVRFAGRTVEFAVPAQWAVKQVPLPGEIRVLAGPGDVPDQPHRLERGLWIAYHRLPATAPQVSLEAELRSRLPQAAGPAFRANASPHTLSVGGFPAAMQTLEVAPSTFDGLPRRASLVLARTPWGLLEAWAVTTIGSVDDVQAGLRMALTSLRLNPPTALPPIASPAISDAQAAVGSWKGRQVSVHFLPQGRVRLDFDTVQTLTAIRDGHAVSGGSGKHIEGSFAAQADVIYITWDDGSQLNYRWQVRAGELLLMDHTGSTSRLSRIFDAPPFPGEGPPMALGPTIQ